MAHMAHQSYPAALYLAHLTAVVSQVVVLVDRELTVHVNHPAFHLSVVLEHMEVLSSPESRLDWEHSAMDSRNIAQVDLYVSLAVAQLYGLELDVKLGLVRLSSDLGHRIRG